MIVQLGDSAVVLIRQPDHAAVAADLIAGWMAGGLPANPRREQILAATRAHDDGWHEEEEAITVDGAGAPVDFISAPAAVKQRVWPRSIDRCASDSPYGAALIAQHALTVYADYRTRPEWQDFFSAMTARRAALLARCSTGEADHIDADYRVVRIADILSLIFCQAWRQPYDHDGFHITLQDARLTITPDPFAGAHIPIRVATRRIARRTYASDAELRSTIAAAPLTFADGTAGGGS